MNKQLDFTEAEIETMLANLDLFSPEEVAEIDRMVDVVVFVSDPLCQSEVDIRHVCLVLLFQRGAHVD